jgi:hypothetical protein
MCHWNGSGYDPDWEADFYDVGALPFDEEVEAYVVGDVDYIIDQANDWLHNTGDYSMDESDHSDDFVFIEED